jgi:hypothetical protein
MTGTGTDPAKPAQEHTRRLLKVFWASAYMHRRAPGRAKETHVIPSVAGVVHHSTGLLRERAMALLTEVTDGIRTDTTA